MKEYTAMSRFIDNTESLRLEQGWTIQALADHIDMLRPQLSNVLSGKNSPTLDTMERIAKGLGVDVQDLLNKQRKKQLSNSA